MASSSVRPKPPAVRLDNLAGYETIVARTKVDGDHVRKMVTVIGTVASVIGVGLTIWTLVVARGARAAAAEARHAVRRGSAAEEFRSLSVMGNEFLSHVEADEVGLAVMRARDLMFAMSIAGRRWDRFLNLEERTSFEEAHAQIGVISRALLANGPPSTVQEKQKLLKICHGVVKTLGQQAGALFSNIEATEDRDAELH